MSKEPTSDNEHRQRDPLVVQIETNFEDVTFKGVRKPRIAKVPVELLLAEKGRTTLKQHQRRGLEWLIEAWRYGWPGVLLADDMGLGKSFQALAFLCWIRANRQASETNGFRTVKGPILIVAPTALLENWIEESEKHLVPNALGPNRADVFGRQIRKFKNVDTAWPSDGPMDWRKLREHDWILTTYETLADNHTSFAKIAFSVALFDEIQKIKEPGTLNTWASKTVNADFVIGLTGTPIENRIEDLWSIMDRIFPSLLGDLKSFSTTYKTGGEDKYRALSEGLMRPDGERPPVLLRRMKQDILDGLPRKTITPYRTVMPPVQAQAYSKIVSQAVGGDRARGTMLEVVQRLRSVSLYPDDPVTFDLTSEKSCHEWSQRSARVGKTFEILRDLERRGEKAIVFVEHRRMQSLFSQAFTTVFKTERPLMINGSTPGPQRQRLVNEFQSRPHGFDLMLLSPKAAGVGLTITAANHVIHLSRWWNPAVEDQCNDRVYRIGQTKPVTIHLPISVHPDLGDRTFDVTLDGLLNRKRQMSRDLLAPPLSEGDLADVFNGTIAA